MHASNDFVLCRAEPLAHQLAEKLSPIEVLFTLMLSLVSLTTVVELALIIRLLNLVERMETFCLSLEVILESGQLRRQLISIWLELAEIRLDRDFIRAAGHLLVTSVDVIIVLLFFLGGLSLSIVFSYKLIEHLSREGCGIKVLITLINIGLSGILLEPLA